MENETYRENAYNKLKLYGQNGIIPSINLITTFETKSHPIDSGKNPANCKRKNLFCRDRRLILSFGFAKRVCSLLNHFPAQTKQQV